MAARLGTRSTRSQTAWRNTTVLSSMSDFKHQNGTTTSVDQWSSTVSNRAEWKRLTRVVCEAYNEFKEGLGG